jgi:ligand-binding SRPBCC domain-containing protein
MPLIELEIRINPPIEICFDLSRSIDLHKISTAHTNEEAIDGVTSGLIGLNAYVTWRAKHFGITQTLTSRITEFNYPPSFTDEMEKGAFKSFKHEHAFKKVDNHTIMVDRFDYQTPLGQLSRIADTLFLKTYMTRLLEGRNLMIKDFAESDKWKEILNK